MISTIYISNILECYYKDYLKLSPRLSNYWITYDSSMGNRALFYGQDKKAIVTTQPMDAAYVKQIQDVMKWKHIVNLFPQPYTYSLSNDLVNESRLHRAFIQLIKQNPGVDIIPYRTTPEFRRLLDRLKELNLTFNVPETLEKEKEFVHLYTNSKRGFRHLWEKAVSNTSVSKKVFLPEGFITTGKQEALDAAWWFQTQKRSFVMKYNFGVQGSGVKLFISDTLPFVRSDFRKKILSKLTASIWDSPCLVVEELISPDQSVFGGSPSIEFYIDVKGKAHKTFPCEQLLEDDNKTFCGVYIHPDLYKSSLIKTAYQAGMLFGNELSRLGYRGFFDVDLVISKTGQIYAVESNLRRTGGTHTYEFSRAFLGNSFMHSYFVASEDVSLKKGRKYEYSQVKDLLSDCMVHKKKQTGVLIYNPSMLNVDKLCVFIIGTSHNEVSRYRLELAKKFKIKKKKV